MKDSPRVVFDCNILLQAAARDRSVAAKCLKLAEGGLVQLCMSREVLAEVEDVLNRPEIRAHFPDLSDEARRRVPQTIAKALSACPARAKRI